MSSLGGIALSVAGAGLAALGAGLTFAVHEAMDSQVAVAGLNTVLASTGGAIGLTSQQLQDMATNLQSVTRFSDEAALGAETMLLRFENIGQDVFPKALKAAADLASVMGTDLTSAAQVVGRALDNPAEGIGRLNQQFKLFNKEQLETIQKMAEMGDVAGAQAMILDALTSKVGGTAEAMGATLAGRIDILKNKISDLGEEIGGRLLPYLEGAMNGADFFGSAIQQGVPPLLALESALRVAGFGPFADGLRAAQEALSPLQGPLEELGNAIVGVLPDFIAAGQQIGDALQQAFGESGPVVMENLKIAISSLADIVTAVGPTIAAAFGIIGSILAGTIGAAAQAVTGLIAAILQLASGDASGALQTFASSISGAFTTLANSVSQAIAGVDFSVVVAQWQANFAMLGTIVSTVAGIIGGAIAGAVGSVTSGLTGIVSEIGNAARSIQATAGAWASAGKALIDGLVGAIKAGASAVVAAVLAVAAQAIAALKAALGIASPSKVMMDIGANLTGSLADALTGGMSIPVNAAMNMGTAVGAAVAAPVASAPVLSGGGGGSGSNVTNYFNITAHDVQDTIAALDRELRNQGRSLASTGGA